MLCEALFTVTFTVVLTVVYVDGSLGVKVTDCEVVPTLGWVDGELKANAPETDAEPPVNEPEASGCPNVIVDDAGQLATVGVALLTVTVKVLLALFPTPSVAVAVTVVLPIGKTAPLLGEYVIVGLPALSVAVTSLNVTIAPFPEVALTTRSAGMVNAGGKVSKPPMFDTEDCSRVRARRKPIETLRNSLPYPYPKPSILEAQRTVPAPLLKSPQLPPR